MNVPLILRIENVDTLPDGGPVFFELDRRGIDIGRDPYLDWTLPDAERFISGKHCEIHFRDGGYWVHDVSTNGTSINGQSGRLTEPHRVQNGDRLYIGQYIILAELIGEDGGGDSPEIRSSAHTSLSLDPWGGVSDAAEAVDKRDFSTRSQVDAGPSVAQGPGDLAEENISWGVEEAVATPATDADVDWATPAPSSSVSSSDDDFGWATPSPGAETSDTPAPDWRDSGSGVDSEAAPAEAPVEPAEIGSADDTSTADPFAEPDEPAVPSTEPAASDATEEASSEPIPEPEDPAPEDAAAGVLATDELSWGTEPATPSEPATDPFAPEAATESIEADSQPQAELAEAVPADPMPTDPAPDVEAAQIVPPPPPEAPTQGDGLASQWADGVQPAQAVSEAVSAASPDVAPAAPGLAGSFIAAFERGAGMPAGSVAGREDEAFAEELGLLLKTVTENLQAMLLARAETKSAMRSSERTMIGALENNPLKFSPSPEDAMRVMFGEKTRSYLDAAQTVEQSFGDLQKHQVQTFGAMQQALQALIDDLDPESIAGATSKDGGLAGLVSSRRAKFWDTYVERFNAKSSRHERGMIDAFMILFAEMYDRQG